MIEEWMMKFAYEDLDVWSKAVDFSVRVINLVDSIDTSRKHFRLLEQIEASSTSISTNIAEGKGRFSKKQFVHYCYIARGSLFETITLLEIFYKMNWINNFELNKLKEIGESLGKMISALINTIKKSIKYP